MPRINDIAYVTYRCPDLDLAERFLGDFGMVRAARTEHALYMRGAGPRHHIYVARRAATPRLPRAEGPAADPPPRPCPLQGDRLPEDLRLVHAHPRHAALRRARRRTGEEEAGRLPALRSRRHLHRPPHRRLRRREAGASPPLLLRDPRFRRSGARP